MYQLNFRQNNGVQSTYCLLLFLLSNCYTTLLAHERQYSVKRINGSLPRLCGDGARTRLNLCSSPQKPVRRWHARLLRGKATGAVSRGAQLKQHCRAEQPETKTSSHGSTTPGTNPATHSEISRTAALLSSRRGGLPGRRGAPSRPARRPRGGLSRHTPWRAVSRPALRLRAAPVRSL